MLTCIGPAAGRPGFLALGRFLAGQLYGIKSNDPVSFIVVSCLLLLIGLVASYIPSARATKMDPAITLRYEREILAATCSLPGLVQEAAPLEQQF